MASRQLTAEKEQTVYSRDNFSFGPGIWVDEVERIFGSGGYSFKRVSPRTYHAVPERNNGHVARVVVSPSDGRGIIEVKHTSLEGRETSAEQITRIVTGLNARKLEGEVK